jgi:2,5-dihydroxypyridine 5,6-dioxygenase
VSDIATSETVVEAARHLVRHCGGLAAGEKMVIVCDPSTTEIGAMIASEARALTDAAVVHTIPAAPIHGTEPPAEVADQMAKGDLVIGLTTMSMAHTQARLRACASGARYLSLPDYTLELMADPSVRADFRARAPVVRRFADAFTAGRTARVVTAAGTDMRLDISGRTGNYCPGFVEGAGSLGSPPDIEANVSPIEDRSEGVVVVDGSIPCAEIGLLQSPVTLHVAAGRIVRFECADPDVVNRLEGLFGAVGTDKAYILAECGVGLNEAARLTGTMLTDEGAMGCMHFGFGSNATVGGLNDVAFHLDFVFRRATLDVDGTILLNQGELAP